MMAVPAKVKWDHSLEEESQGRQEECDSDVKAVNLGGWGRCACFPGIEMIKVKQGDNEARINQCEAGDPRQILFGTARDNEILPHDCAHAAKPGDSGKAPRAGIVRADGDELAALLNPSSSFRVTRCGVQGGLKNVGFLP